MSEGVPKNRLAVVLPVYNEEAGIAVLLRTIEEHVEFAVEFVIVDDGSVDNSLRAIREYVPVKRRNRKKIVTLTRNFGHQNALMAGLHHVAEDCALVLVMDADFQDDPRDVASLLKPIEEGYDCVYAVRESKGDNWLFSLLARVFYLVQSRVASFSIPENAGTFSVFNRNVLQKILELEEKEIYFPGLRAYVGYRQVGVAVQRRGRDHGTSRVGLRRLVNLSAAGLLGFSELPMRLILVLGLLTTILCALAGIAVFVLRVTGVTNIPGITTVLIVMVGLFGVLIMFLGVVGEYIGKLFVEAKGRPRWIVNDVEVSPRR